MEHNAHPEPEERPLRARQLVLRLLGPALERADIAAGDVDDSFNVIDRGIVDSLEFLDLIARLEDRAGVQLDLFDADPEVLTTVGGLTSMLEKQLVHR